MTVTPRPTEPLRAEHRELMPRVEAFDAFAADLHGWSAAEATRQLDDVVAFLRGHLVPHARAEEVVLYPAIERAMNAPDATATMRADHTEIMARIDRLAETTGRVEADWPDPGLRQELSRQLIGLAAILLLHFHKEENVLLPVLDARLSPQEAQELFEHMGEMAHE
jgi:iron-sulfur cluster repair protein YtfE (RIC family)